MAHPARDWLHQGSKFANRSEPAEDPNMTIPGDNPIQNPKDDTLGRSDTARVFADHLLALDCTNGVAVGVVGVWGSGKTSFITLVRWNLTKNDIPVLDFNPWMFSGAEQLVGIFFAELSAQLSGHSDTAKIADTFLAYGESLSGFGWVPVAGPWLDRLRVAVRVVRSFLPNRDESIGSQRDKLRQDLAQLDRPIVVVLDDIDRLSTNEIRNVFKLVRLTASFPNIIYVLAYDRRRVESALNEEGISGREYLEKIVQLEQDLPAVPDGVMQSQFFEAMDDVLSGIENAGVLDGRTWPDLFTEIIWPLVGNMRDVKRYAMSIWGTVYILAGKIALADVLALEAVRVFRPDVFALLHGTASALTTNLPLLQNQQTDPHKAAIAALIEASKAKSRGKDGSKLVQNLILRLFPAAARHVGGGTFASDFESAWQRNKRVANRDILRLYLEHAEGEGLQALSDGGKAWAVMSDETAFDHFLRSINVSRLRDIVAALEDYESEYSAEHVVPGITVLLNLLPVFPRPAGSMFELSPRTTVARVVLRLLRSLENEDSIAEAVEASLPRIRSLSSKLELLDIVGHRDNIGHKLISETAAKRLEASWREEVRAATTEDLVVEADLFRVLVMAVRGAEEEERAAEVGDMPDLTMAILQTAQTERTSQEIGSRAVTVTPLLQWEGLVELFGSEEALVKRIEALPAAESDHEELLALARKYAGGWRPSSIDED